MQRHYGVELCALWRGELTLRRVRVLIEYLPVDSLTARRIANVDRRELDGWSLTNLLLSRVADELSAFRWQWETTHLGKRQRARKQPQSVLPEPVDEQKNADVIPLVSPHKLGAFIHDDEQEH